MTPREKYAAIVAEVAEKHGVTVEDITGHRRLRRISQARWEAWYRFRKEVGWSYQRLAEMLKVDHSSILYAVHQHAAAHGLPVGPEPAFRSIRGGGSVPRPEFISIRGEARA